MDSLRRPYAGVALVYPQTASWRAQSGHDSSGAPTYGLPGSIAVRAEQKPVRRIAGGMETVNARSWTFYTTARIGINDRLTFEGTDYTVTEVEIVPLLDGTEWHRVVTVE